MAGNASFGQQREEYDLGDYIAQVVDVSAEDADDLKNPGTLKPVFIWKVDVAVDGEWQSRKVFTGRRFTDMKTNKDPRFVAGLNKFVRACGMPVPQTADAAAEWDENDLIGKQFIWRVEEDEETGGRVRKYVRVQPQAQAADSNGKNEEAAPRQTTGGVGVRSEPAPARTRQSAAVAVADDEDPFGDQ